ncbi:MAG: GNAT family N-acetyltransferase [Nakamurella sp.]
MSHQEELESFVAELVRTVQPPVAMVPGPWPLAADGIGIGDDILRALLTDDWADAKMRPAQLRKLLDVQLVTRNRQNGGDHPRGRDLGIVVADEVVGRILLDLDDDTVEPKTAPIVLVDIAIHPQRQRQGVGAEVLRALLAVASGSNRNVQLAAVFGTPALRWFVKSGFADTGGDALYRQLRWSG